MMLEPPAAKNKSILLYPQMIFFFLPVIGANDVSHAWIRTYKAIAIDPIIAYACMEMEIVGGGILPLCCGKPPMAGVGLIMHTSCIK